MKSSDAIKCILGACLASAFLAPESLALMSLLCLLPYARAQSNPNTWVSLQGVSGEKYHAKRVTPYGNASYILSGFHDNGNPNYDAVVTTTNEKGELTSNVQLEIGTSSIFRDSILYENAIYSTGHFIDGQTKGLLCKTSLNGTFIGCFELTGISGTTQLVKMLVTTNNNLLITGQNGLLVEMYPNTTLKFAIKYPISSYSLVPEALIETPDNEYIFSGRTNVEGVVLKTTNYGEKIWISKLTNPENSYIIPHSITQQHDVLTLSSRLDSTSINAGIIKINSTTGYTISALTLGGGTETRFYDHTSIGSSILAVGVTNKNSFGQEDALGVIISDNITSIFRIAGAKYDLFTSVFSDEYGNVIIAGTTASYTEDLNKHKAMLLKLDSNLTLNGADLPPGLGYYDDTNNFEINYNPTLINTDITSNINPIDITSTTSFSDITDQVTVSHPLENTWLHAPTGQPTGQPSGPPSGQPSTSPSAVPSGQPSTHVFSTEDSWFTVNGQTGRQYLSVDLVNCGNDYLHAPGYSWVSWPNYLATLSTYDTDGNYIQDFTLNLEDPTLFRAALCYDNIVYSIGQIDHDTQSNGLICKTHNNGTFIGCSEFELFGNSSAFYSGEIASDGRLIFVGSANSKGTAVAIHPSNFTVSWQYTYPNTVNTANLHPVFTGPHTPEFHAITTNTHTNEYTLYGKEHIVTINGDGEVTKNNTLIAPDGSRMITDYSASQDDLTAITGQYILPGHYRIGTFIATINETTGNVTSFHHFTGNGEAHPKDIMFLPSGTIIMSGHANIDDFGGHESWIVSMANNTPTSYYLGGPRGDSAQAALYSNSAITFLGSTGFTTHNEPTLFKVPESLDFSGLDLPDDYKYVDITNNLTLNTPNVVSISTPSTTAEPFNATFTNIENIPLSKNLLQTNYKQPIVPTFFPTGVPSAYPTYYPSGVPSGYPSAGPSG
ncbi:MAG: PT domain-containing protein, partial [Legionellaceae bacterium]|nr:PT domain-containing protein [Legionellaceae bacterium]